MPESYRLRLRMLRLTTWFRLRRFVDIQVSQLTVHKETILPRFSIFRAFLIPRIALSLSTQKTFVPFDDRDISIPDLQ